ncbi:TPA_asm: hypothetical protein GIM83_01730 [Listeria monocytogenes]|nr:hypothetical protein [Listeria monocytogenes]HAC1349043.1 hypothetical protein [Listeria monocytogenes]HAC1583989.1 hypothetical protein [Listeria monocytogenes]HAC1980087.1 hypothetical protein [Listeria monocytogenes]HAC1986490.1 hypothetical protein [Listeria monocytogenes]
MNINTNTNTKYVFTGEERVESGVSLRRIMATRTFGLVWEGQIGGWIERESNLSHEGNSWVGFGATVSGRARVQDDAQVLDEAQVLDYAQIRGSSLVKGKASISDKACVGGRSIVADRASVSGNAFINGSATIGDDAKLFGSASLTGGACIRRNAHICGWVSVSGEAIVKNNALISDDAHICWVSHVGSERGTLTAYLDQNKEVRVIRGCFEGSLPDFEKAVRETHNKGKFATEYEALIQFLKIRFGVSEETGA